MALDKKNTAGVGESLPSISEIQGAASATFAWAQVLSDVTVPNSLGWM